MERYISDEELRRQAWKYWVVVLAWPVYLFCIPAVFDAFGWWAVLLMVWSGAWLYTWIGCLMHECWHKYVPNVPNEGLYKVYSWMLGTDPQNYRLVHGFHHSKVNSWEDTEFHPVGEVREGWRRRMYNAAEILLGVIWTFGLLTAVLGFHERYREKWRLRSLLVSLAAVTVFYGGIGTAAVFVWGVAVWQAVVAIGLSFWLGAFWVHQDQLVQHGGLIVEGDVKERNIRSRNLRRETVWEKAFLFMVHGDCREHVLHHTNVREHSRVFADRMPLPEGAVVITLGDYGRVLWGMVR
ncbi:Fatty acid desaturase [Anaerohalosphaera lusitana]|uniref:Fatty acid desaturase n=1 Tax=Anaerohalosphaera lusitana TaxID=1936003 RepID=A0A1U9NQX7_9BACT|nr:fatty acid desaturase [Anaerohalosphaera lusitana]AQT70319.1 Fatty acid desaturase [Anaerohalosphaera lusitana]